jgi:hypothetical protein
MIHRGKPARAALLLFAAAVFALGTASPACKGKTGLTDAADKALAEQEAVEAADRAAAEEAAAKPEPKPEPKVNEEIYVEITARSVLLREKYAETPDRAEEEIEKVCETLGATMTDYKEYAKTLVPPKTYELQKKVQEKIQVLAPQYR